MTIVPTRAMQLIERALADGDAEVQIAAAGERVLVKSPRATIYSRLVEGRFPEVARRVPAATDAVQIEMVVGPLYSAVRQAAIVTSEESRGVDFTFGDGKLVLAGRAAEIGQSRVEMPIAYDGPADVDHARPALLQRLLQGARPGKDVHFGNERLPRAPRSARTDDGYAYVIMPLARDR